MRILDVGVAAGYALLCLSLISVMSPYGAGAEAARNLSDARAGAAVYDYVAAVGLVFLAVAPPAQICVSLQQHGNATFVLGGDIAGYLCPGIPTAFHGGYAMTFSLPGREETIQAWTVGE